MPYSFRERLGLWLQRFTWLDRWLLYQDGTAVDGSPIMVNRITRFWVKR